MKNLVLVPRHRLENFVLVSRCRVTDTPMPQLSAESLEQDVEGDPRKQLELSVSRYELDEWKYEFKNVVVHWDNVEFALHRSGAKGQD